MDTGDKGLGGMRSHGSIPTGPTWWLAASVLEACKVTRCEQIGRFKVYTHGPGRELEAEDSHDSSQCRSSYRRPRQPDVLRTSSPPGRGSCAHRQSRVLSPDKQHLNGGCAGCWQEGTCNRDKNASTHDLGDFKNLTLGSALPVGRLKSPPHPRVGVLQPRVSPVVTTRTTETKTSTPAMVAIWPRWTEK